MKLKVKDLKSAVEKVGAFVTDRELQGGIMLNIGDINVKVCFSDGNKTLMQTIDIVESNDTDVKGKIIVNYKKLVDILNVFSMPAGNCVAEDMEIIFFSNTQNMALMAQKQEVLEDGEIHVANVIREEMQWVSSNATMKTAFIDRAMYDEMLHFTPEYIEDHFSNRPVKPLDTATWELEADEWEVSELKSLLEKLSIESNKTVCISPEKRYGFVQNTSCVIVKPVNADIKNSIVLDTTNAKSIASVLSKLTDNDKIYVHTTGENTRVFSTVDNRFAMSLSNAKVRKSDIQSFTTYKDMNYTNIMMIFDKGVLKSAIDSFKLLKGVEKGYVTFELKTDLENGVYGNMSLADTKTSKNSEKHTTEISKIQLMNNNIELLNNMIVELPIDILSQAVNNVSSNSVAFDISYSDTLEMGAQESRVVRIGGMSVEQREQINVEYGLEDDMPWTPEFMKEHREDLLDYTTYFSVTGKERK